MWSLSLTSTYGVSPLIGARFCYSVIFICNSSGPAHLNWRPWAPMFQIWFPKQTSNRGFRGGCWGISATSLQVHQSLSDFMITDCLRCQCIDTSNEIVSRMFRTALQLKLTDCHFLALAMLSILYVLRIYNIMLHSASQLWEYNLIIQDRNIVDTDWMVW